MYNERGKQTGKQSQTEHKQWGIENNNQFFHTNAEQIGTKTTNQKNTGSRKKRRERGKGRKQQGPSDTGDKNK